MKTPCQEAQDITTGARQQAYGHPLDNLTRVSKLWSAILGVEVTAEQVALCLVALKLSRECNRHSPDNLVDIAGYANVIYLMDVERQRRAHAPKS